MNTKRRRALVFHALMVLLIGTAIFLGVFTIVSDYEPTCGNPTHHGNHTHE